MFSLKIVIAILPFLVSAAPSPVEDWKTLLGWDGKVFTVEQIESNTHLVIIAIRSCKHTSTHTAMFNRTLVPLMLAACTSAPTRTSRETVYIITRTLRTEQLAEISSRSTSAGLPQANVSASAPTSTMMCPAFGPTRV